MLEQNIMTKPVLEEECTVQYIIEKNIYIQYTVSRILALLFKCCYLKHHQKWLLGWSTFPPSIVSLPLNRKTSLWSVQREVSFHPQCCHCLSLSTLSTHPHLISAQWKKCVCVFVYSCCSATSSAFLSLSIFVLLQSCCFSPKYLSPPVPPLPLLSLSPSLSLSLFLHQPTKNPYYWLLWDLVAMQRQDFHMVLACMHVYCSVTEFGCHVDWEGRERCCSRNLVGPNTWPIHKCAHTYTYTHTLEDEKAHSHTPTLRLCL